MPSGSPASMDFPFQDFQDEESDEFSTTLRDTCTTCTRPMRVCWCPYLPNPKIKTSTQVIILQHPNEEKRNLRTAPMLFHGLEPDRCLIFKGKKFPTAHPRHNGLAEILSRPNILLLYPGKTAKCLAEFIPHLETSESGEANYTLVLIDGTWPQAKTMYFHSPMLHTIPQVSLPPAGPSQFVVRTQPAENCLSTVESAAYALSLLENRPELSDLLCDPLRALCTFQLRYGAVEHCSKMSQLELGLYRKPVGKRTYPHLRRTAPSVVAHLEQLKLTNSTS